MPTTHVQQEKHVFVEGRNKYPLNIICVRQSMWTWADAKKNENLKIPYYHCGSAVKPIESRVYTG